MKQLRSRGKRIRPTDKDLVFHTAIAALLPVFLLIVMLFHGRSIMQTDWQDVSLSQIGESIHIPYLLISIGAAGLFCLAAALVFRHYRRDYVKQLYHRQKLARMVLENKWYEAEQVQSDGFFKDLSSSRSKEKISYFPKIYYQLKSGLIHIRVEIINPVADTVATATFQGAEVDWYIKADDIILKKGAAPAGNPQPPKKDIPSGK